MSFDDHCCGKSFICLGKKRMTWVHIKFMSGDILSLLHMEEQKWGLYGGHTLTVIQVILSGNHPTPKLSNEPLPKAEKKAAKT